MPLLSSGYVFSQEKLLEMNPLQIAVKDRHVETVSRLLSQGADVNQSTCRGLTPLHLASAGRSLGVVKMLVDAGADVNSCDRFKMTPLLNACYVGRETIGRYLIEKGAVVNACGILGRTALRFAIATKPCGMSFISDLLRAGACVNDRDDFGQTPLHAAIIRWKRYPNASTLDILQLLLTYPCDIDAADVHGTTALHLAARFEAPKAALMLILAGCKMDIKDEKGMTPVSSAIICKNHDVLEMLLAAGACVSRSDLLKVQALRMLNDPTKWERVLASCTECPRLSRMCRRTLYDHYGTQAKNCIETLSLPPLIKRYLYFDIL